jgi:hypothetical protein
MSALSGGVTWLSDAASASRAPSAASPRHRQNDLDAEVKVCVRRESKAPPRNQGLVVEENRVLKEQVKGRRLRLTDDQR